MSVPIICKSKGLVSKFPQVWKFYKIMDFFLIFFLEPKYIAEDLTRQMVSMYCNELVADWTIEM